MIENLLEGYFFDKTFGLVMTSLRVSLDRGRGRGVSWAGGTVSRAGYWWGPWHPSAQKAAISGEHSTTGGLDVVPAVWANLRDYSVDVPSFGGVILYCDIRTNIDLWESVGVRVVILCDPFHVRGCLLVYLCCPSLPLGCEGSVMCCSMS